MLDMKTTYKLKNGIVLRSISGKYWALDTITGKQFKLNEVSYFILDLFRTQKTFEQMINCVLNEYNVTQERLTADCDIVLRFAVTNNLIEEENS